MPFIWDESKRQTNLRRRSLDFVDAEKVFNDPYAWSAPDPRYFDDRWLLIGKLGKGIVVIIAYTERQPETYRIISMRQATSREIDRYTEHRFSQSSMLQDPLVELLEKLEKEREKE